MSTLIEQSDKESLDSACADSERSLELAVVIPTFNERGNIRPLLAALTTALVGVTWEVVFVDYHSPDCTADLVREIAKTNRHVRVLERIGRRGLSSACIEGALATAAPYIAVMDADLQHDARLLPIMLERIKREKLDLVIASLALPQGDRGDSSLDRVRLSVLGQRISRLVCRYDVSDAMSGFFLVDSNFFRRAATRLSGRGFKILVDLLATSPQTIRVAELPYHFRGRQWGESKLDFRAKAEYIYLVLDKSLGRVLPTRFVLYSAVGSIGVILHVGILALLFYQARVGFIEAQAGATASAMTLNFLLNNALTFRDKRLRGWGLFKGLLTFYAACALGALINLSVANSLFRSNVVWWLAAICGLGVSSVWNYGVNAAFTWRREKQPASFS